MPESKLDMLFQQQRLSQDKYTYFLLAAAGAAIGLAVTQTQTATLAWTQLPLGIAVLCWGASFVCGCRRIAYTQSNLYANSELLRIQAGTHPEVGNSPDVVRAASEGVRSAMEFNSDATAWWANAQFRLLVSGAGFYIAWHLTEMTARTLTAESANTAVFVSIL